MWGTLIAQFVGAAAKPINVSAPDPSTYELKSSPLTTVAVIAGIGAVGALTWWVIKR